VRVLDWLKEIFDKNWEMVRQHPGPFIFMLCFGFLLAKGFYAERLEVMGERLKAKDEDLERHKKANTPTRPKTGYRMHKGRPRIGPIRQDF